MSLKSEKEIIMNRTFDATSLVSPAALGPAAPLDGIMAAELLKNETKRNHTRE